MKRLDQITGVVLFLLSVFYVVEGSLVKIIAISHGARHPRWLGERRRQVG